MVRTREFDPEVALDKAMALFWDRGFAQTSMEELVQHTGVSRYGLYGAFGNKDAIYRAALTRYTTVLMDELQQNLKKPDAALPEILEYFQNLAEYAASREGQKGCLIVSAANEMAPQDPELAAHLRSMQGSQRKIFETALKNAQAAGQVRETINPAATASTFVALLQGLAVLHRTGADDATMWQAMDGLMSAIT